MHFIEHIIEPTKLLLAWQSLDESHRTRYIVGELNLTDTGVDLHYLVNTRDFDNALAMGFVSFPAFPELTKTHYNVLNTFMRRLPPRSRGDFSQYLEGIRLRPNARLSDFALLGYSGGKLLSDGFSVIHPFDHVNGPCELLLEIAGFRHIKEQQGLAAPIAGTPADFVVENEHEITKEHAIAIIANGNKLGYVNRGILPTLLEWINERRVVHTWVEKVTGTPERQVAYVFVEIAGER